MTERRRSTRLSHALPALMTAIAAVAAMPTAYADHHEEAGKSAEAPKTETGTPVEAPVEQAPKKKKRAANPCAGN